MSAASNTANTFATGNIAINIVLGSSLKLLWGMINMLQFVVFFTDWRVLIPPNASMAIETFRVIALGEFIPYDWLTEPLSEPFQGPDDDTDASRANVLSNMGIMLLFGGVILILALLAVCLVRCCRKSEKCRALFQKLKNKILWNSVLRFALQSYLKNSMAVLFSLYVMSFTSKGDTGILNGLISIVLVLGLIALPIFFAVILHRNRSNLETEAMKAKIGTLYLGMRTKTASQRMYSSIFLARRLLYAILTVVCINNPNILIHVFLASNILYVVYLGLTNPNDTKISLRQEYVNESFL